MDDNGENAQTSRDDSPDQQQQHQSHPEYRDQQQPPSTTTSRHQSTTEPPNIPVTQLSPPPQPPIPPPSSSSETAATLPYASNTSNSSITSSLISSNPISTTINPPPTAVTIPTATTNPPSISRKSSMSKRNSTNNTTTNNTTISAVTSTINNGGGTNPSIQRKSSLSQKSPSGRRFDLLSVGGSSSGAGAGGTGTGEDWNAGGSWGGGGGNIPIRSRSTNHGNVASNNSNNKYTDDTGNTLNVIPGVNAAPHSDMHLSPQSQQGGGGAAGNVISTVSDSGIAVLGGTGVGAGTSSNPTTGGAFSDETNIRIGSPTTGRGSGSGSGGGGGTGSEGVVSTSTGTTGAATAAAGSSSNTGGGGGRVKRSPTTLSHHFHDAIGNITRKQSVLSYQEPHTNMSTDSNHQLHIPRQSSVASAQTPSLHRLMVHSNSTKFVSTGGVATATATGGPNFTNISAQPSVSSISSRGGGGGGVSTGPGEVAMADSSSRNQSGQSLDIPGPPPVRARSKKTGRDESHRWTIMGFPSSSTPERSPYATTTSSFEVQEAPSENAGAVSTVDINDLLALPARPRTRTSTAPVSNRLSFIFGSELKKSSSADLSVHNTPHSPTSHLHSPTSPSAIYNRVSVYNAAATAAATTTTEVPEIDTTDLKHVSAVIASKLQATNRGGAHTNTISYFFSASPSDLGCGNDNADSTADIVQRSNVDIHTGGATGTGMGALIGKTGVTTDEDDIARVRRGSGDTKILSDEDAIGAVIGGGKSVAGGIGVVPPGTGSGGVGSEEIPMTSSGNIVGSSGAVLSNELYKSGLTQSQYQSRRIPGSTGHSRVGIGARGVSHRDTKKSTARNSKRSSGGPRGSASSSGSDSALRIIRNILPGKSDNVNENSDRDCLSVWIFIFVICGIIWAVKPRERSRVQLSEGKVEA
ncbi:hypothetical protein HDU76_012377 [Blyttiomyces sp. JEL0837]|nr:hypothetical protein HDU76_012377 [Blyttiomyces sp. JEL0837]